VVSRRGFLRAAGAGAVAGAGVGAAVGVAACGTRPAAKPPAGEPEARRSELHSDVAALNGALEREHLAIAAYTAGIPLLSAPARAAARQFLSQEFSHAAELSALIRRGGGIPSSPAPNGYALGNPRSDADVLALLHRVEQDLISHYLAILPTLVPGQVRATVASILANEAQHVSVIRSQRGLPAVPSPLLAAPR
jgi:hypothetical protein